MAAWILALCIGSAAAGQMSVATVDGQPITRERLQLHLTLRGASGEKPVPEKVRDAAVEALVERALIARFLKRHKTEANPSRLEIAVAAARKSLPSENREAIDQKLLADYLALPLAWNRYVRRVVTDEQIRKYHAEHKRTLDGTRLRVSQIFIKYRGGESARKAPRTTAELKTIRDALAAKKATFEDAARQHSESPTADSGGEVGWIDPKGDLPEPVSSAAFGLEQGDVSEIVLSPFGAHLVTVTDVDPGRLSLEDIRPAIMARLSRQRWEETVARERAQTEIEITE